MLWSESPIPRGWVAWADGGSGWHSGTFRREAGPVSSSAENDVELKRGETVAFPFATVLLPDEAILRDRSVVPTRWLAASSSPHPGSSMRSKP